MLCADILMDFKSVNKKFDKSRLTIHSPDCWQVFGVANT